MLREQNLHFIPLDDQEPPHLEYFLQLASNNREELWMRALDIDIFYHCIVPEWPRCTYFNLSSLLLHEKNLGVSVRQSLWDLCTKLQSYSRFTEKFFLLKRS